MEDQERAKVFWAKQMGFEIARAETRYVLGQG